MNINIKFSKLYVSIFIALLFHISGAVGILHSPYKNWFIQNTPLNLLVMAVLLLYNQSQKNKYFIAFAIIAFATGMFTEMIGVNTGLLFGQYTYGSVMGYGIKGVPLLIGIQWLVTVLCSGAIMHQFQHGIENRYSNAGLKMKPILHTISFVFDGALLATFFDFIMEPVAMKLGFWNWQNNDVPNYNYWCWFFISALLLGLYKIMPFKKANQFAIHLFIIQLLFFIALRFFL